MAVTAPGTQNPADGSTILTAWGDAVNADLTSIDTEISGSVPKVLNRTAALLDISDTTTGTVLYAFTVPANAMGTDRAVAFDVYGDYLNSSGSGRSFTLHLLWGTDPSFAIPWQDSSPSIATSAVRRGFRFSGLIGNRNATNVQSGGGWVSISSTGSLVSGVGDFGVAELLSVPIAFADSTEDTTQNQTIILLVTHAFAATTISLRRLYANAVLL